jgi:hypothetical protein
MKYIKLFEEFNVKIGQGGYHNVYEIDDDFVLKMPYFYKGNSKEEEFKKHISFMKNNPDYFVNVKQLSKYRASIERVDTLQAKKELRYIDDFSHRFDLERYGDISHDMFKNYYHIYDDLSRYATATEDVIVNKWLNFIIKLKKLDLLKKKEFGKNLDIHNNQFGIDKNGNIKLLDF